MLKKSVFFRGAKKLEKERNPNPNLLWYSLKVENFLLLLVRLLLSLSPYTSNIGHIGIPFLMWKREPRLYLQEAAAELHKDALEQQQNNLRNFKRQFWKLLVVNYTFPLYSLKIQYICHLKLWETLFHTHNSCSPRRSIWEHLSKKELRKKQKCRAARSDRILLSMEDRGDGRWPYRDWFGSEYV
jgi:hypothetical protein